MLIHLSAALLAAVLGAAPPAPAPASNAAPVAGEARKAPAAKEAPLVCKTKSMSASRVRTRKVCGREREWNNLSDASRHAADEMRDTARGACNTGQPCGGP